MVNKFIETANKVGDKVHAIEFLVILKGSAFHLPLLYQETFFLMKSIVAFNEIKKKKKKFFFFLVLIFKNLMNFF